mgnify:CR=1 FL=1
MPRKKTLIKLEAEFDIPQGKNEATEMVESFVDLIRSQFVRLNQIVSDHRKRYSIDERITVIGEEVIEDGDSHSN